MFPSCWSCISASCVDMQYFINILWADLTPGQHISLETLNVANSWLVQFSPLSTYDASRCYVILCYKYFLRIGRFSEIWNASSSHNLTCGSLTADSATCVVRPCTARNKLIQKYAKHCKFNILKRPWDLPVITIVLFLKCHNSTLHCIFGIGLNGQCQMPITNYMIYDGKQKSFYFCGFMYVPVSKKVIVPGTL